jgi:hypothetical protein
MRTTRDRTKRSSQNGTREKRRRDGDRGLSSPLPRTSRNGSTNAIPFGGPKFGDRTSPENSGAPGLKGQRFETLQEAQAYLDRWEEHWADTRIHGTTKRQVAAMFESVVVG